MRCVIAKVGCYAQQQLSGQSQDHRQHYFRTVLPIPQTEVDANPPNQEAAK